eukprot:scaffold549506_cov37-Prasinocladus_malaysianus.AAC.1
MSSEVRSGRWARVDDSHSGSMGGATSRLRSSLICWKSSGGGRLRGVMLLRLSTRSLQNKDKSPDGQGRSKGGSLCPGVRWVRAAAPRTPQRRHTRRIVRQLSSLLTILCITLTPRLSSRSAHPNLSDISASSSCSSPKILLRWRVIRWHKPGLPGLCSAIRLAVGLVSDSIVSLARFLVRLLPFVECFWS